ncbi:MAG: DUF2335 domain-containing protein [Bacteroidales bacterium]|nr:DUF2335 domain-containing protein [Bacteroidales bacterium]
MDSEEELHLSQQETEKLPDEIEKIIEDLPDEKKVEARKKILSLSTTIIAHQSHSGPLPSPQTIKNYDSVIENGAERIFRMTENQSNHRIEIEKKIYTSQIRQSGIGQIFGFIIAIIALLIAWDLAKLNQVAVASIIGGTTVIGLVTIFVIGRKRKKNSKNPE